MSGHGDARLVMPPVEDLDDAQADLYRQIVSSRSGARPAVPAVDASGSLQGPFGAMLLNPALGGPLQEVGHALRASTQLSARIRETTVLAVAAHHDCAFERYAHEPLAVQAGLTQAEVAAIRRGEFEPEDPTERIAAEIVARLLAGEPVADELYARAVGSCGPRWVFELTTLVGYYTTLAMLLSIFDIGAPDEA